MCDKKEQVMMCPEQTGMSESKINALLYFHFDFG